MCFICILRTSLQIHTQEIYFATLLPFIIFIKPYIGHQYLGTYVVECQYFIVINLIHKYIDKNEIAGILSFINMD
jgi:hypothetical protein